MIEDCCLAHSTNLMRLDFLKSSSFFGEKRFQQTAKWCDSQKTFVGTGPGEMKVPSGKVAHRHKCTHTKIYNK